MPRNEQLHQRQTPVSNYYPLRKELKGFEMKGHVSQNNPRPKRMTALTEKFY
jgi:hypothetical protein